MFRTENMYTYLELDTRTGRIWQVSFAVSKDAVRAKFFINSEALATTPEDGRFTLYPTDNMWTFILVDQVAGNVWQAQFSMDRSEGRFIIPIPLRE